METRLISDGENFPADFFELEKEINSTGQISIALNRKENFFSSSISGPENSFAIISKDKDQIKAIASLNKIPFSIGDSYIGQVGVLSSVKSKDKNGFATFRGLKIIAQCFKHLKIDAILAFVLEENQRVIQMLEKQRKLFTIKNVGRFYTYVIPIRGLKKNYPASKELTVSWATKKDSRDLISFYQRSTKSEIQCPNLSNEILEKSILKNFGIENFVALKKDGKIVCMLGVCNQLEYRSWTITKYNKLTKLFRIYLNLFAPLTRRVHLPPTNQDFKNLNLVFLSYENQNLDYFQHLLSEISEDPEINQIADNFTICLAENNPLRSALRKFENSTLISKCFMLFSNSEVNELQNRVTNLSPMSFPQIEACIL